MSANSGTIHRPVYFKQVMTHPLCFTADALHFNTTMFCWILLIPFSLMLNLDIALAYVANFFFIFIHSSLPLSSTQDLRTFVFQKYNISKHSYFRCSLEM